MHNIRKRITPPVNILMDLYKQQENHKSRIWGPKAFWDFVVEMFLSGH